MVQISYIAKKAKLINKDLKKEDVSKWLKKQAVYQQTIERPLIQSVENLLIFTIGLLLGSLLSNFYFDSNKKDEYVHLN